jgi:hypothetical protein
VAKNKQDAAALEIQIDQVATQLTSELVEFNQLKSQQTESKVAGTDKKIYKSTK